MHLSNRRGRPVLYHYHVVRHDPDGAAPVTDPERVSRRRDCRTQVAKRSLLYRASTWSVKRCDCGRHVGGL